MAGINSRKLRFGIWSENLSARRPRGVARVARRFAEVLAQKADVEYFAVHGFDHSYGCSNLKATALDEFLARSPYVFGTDDVLPDPKTISAAHIDLILSFECFEQVWDWPLKHEGIKAACVVHDLIPFRIDEGGGYGNRVAYFKRLGTVVQAADLLISNSSATQQDLNFIFPQSVGKADVIYPGLGLPVRARAHPSEERRSPELFTVLMIGTVERRKNFQSVLAAAARIAKALSPRAVRLVLAGDHPRDSSLKTTFSALVSEARQHVEVRLMGFVTDEETDRLYREADVVVCPSLWEGFGLTILEAMSRGTIVVASGLSSHPEVGGRFCFYCDPYDADDIAAKVVAAAGLDRTSDTILRHQARGWAERFQWSASGDLLHNRLLRLAHGSEAISRNAPADLKKGTQKDSPAAGFALLLSSLRSEVDVAVDTIRYLLSEDDGGRSVLLLIYGPSDLRTKYLDRYVERIRAMAAPRHDVDCWMIPESDAALSDAERDVRDILNGSFGPPILDVLSNRSEQRRSLGAVTLSCLYAETPDVATLVSAAVRDVSTTIPLFSAQGHGRDMSAGPIVLDVIKRSLRTEEQLDDVARAVFQGRGLAGALVRTTYFFDDPGQTPCLPLLAGPGRVEQGVDILVLDPRPDVLHALQAVLRDIPFPRIAYLFRAESDARPTGGYGFGMICPDEQTRVRLCLASKTIVGQFDGPRHIPRELTIAAGAGRRIFAQGTDDAGDMNTYLGIEIVENPETLARKVCDYAFRSPVVREGSRADMLPPYPARFDIVVSALAAIATDRPVAPEDRADLAGILGRSDVKPWGERAASARNIVPAWTYLQSTFGQITPSPVERPQHLSLLQSGSVEAAAERSFKAEPDISLVAAIDDLTDASGLSRDLRPWADGWIEQQNRLLALSAFDFLCCSGSVASQAVFDGFSSFDFSFLTAITKLSASVLIAGGRGFSPVPASNVFVTGPLKSSDFCSKYVRFGLIPPLATAEDEHHAASSLDWYRKAGLVTFCPERVLARVDVGQSTQGGSAFISYSSFDDFVARWREASVAGAAEPSGRSIVRHERKTVDVRDPAIVDCSLAAVLIAPDGSAIRQDLEASRSGMHRFPPGHAGTAIRLTIPGVDRDIIGPHGTVSGFYPMEVDHEYRRFRWLGPHETASIALPVITSGQLEIWIDINRMGECAPDDVTLKVNSVAVAARWIRLADGLLRVSTLRMPAPLTSGKLTIEVSARKGFSPDRSADDRDILRVAVSQIVVNLFA